MPPVNARGEQKTMLTAENRNDRRRTIIAIGTLFLLFICCGFSTALPAWSDCSDGLQVNSYYGHYDASQKRRGFPSASLTGPKKELWCTVPPAREYHIGVLLPHLNDTYWETADYGIITHARRLGVRVTVFLAGSYMDLGNQKDQLRHLYRREGVDGVILASVDYHKMDQFVAEANREGVPVVALINDVLAPTVKAKSMVSFFDMGYKAAEAVLRDAGGRNITVAFFPGPQESGWAADTFQGFLEGLARHKSVGQHIRIHPPLYGDTRQDVQQMRLDVLSKRQNHGVDYIVGNAVAAVEAVAYLERHRDSHPGAKIVATYLTATVFREIRNGKILAAPSDEIISQCRIALDMMVRILNGEEPGRDFPFRAAAMIPLLTTANVHSFDAERLFGESGFQPVYSRYRPEASPEQDGNGSLPDRPGAAGEEER